MTTPKELSDYIDGMLTDISNEKGISKLNLIVEYQQAANELYGIIYLQSNYKPIPLQGEIKIYEAAMETIFNKYIN